MTKQTENTEWYHVLALSRVIASDDLKASNDLLDVVDKLAKAAESDNLKPDEVLEIAKHLMDIAIKLADKSRVLSSSISKLAGVS